MYYPIAYHLVKHAIDVSQPFLAVDHAPAIETIGRSRAPQFALENAPCIDQSLRTLGKAQIL